MTERIVAPRLADIIEAIERIRHVLDGVTLEAFEQNWEKRALEACARQSGGNRKSLP